MKRLLTDHRASHSSVHHGRGDGGSLACPPKPWRRRVTPLSLSLLLLACPAFSEEAATQGAAAGAALAARLRTLGPPENSEISGLLIIKSRRGPPVRQIPVVCRIVLRPDGWDSIYETAPTPFAGAEKLIIKHFTKAPSQYLLASGPPGSSPPPEPKPVPPDQLEAPLAGSDFSLGELGLDFLFWPGQNQLKGEMRMGEPCYVLESKSASGRRIKSWIDKESVEQGNPGVLIAESYNPRGELVKEFDLGGSSFKKVNGRYQLQQIKIRSVKERSDTTLKFNLTDRKNP